MVSNKENTRPSKHRKREFHDPEFKTIILSFTNNDLHSANPYQKIHLKKTSRKTA
jgi:hypothetical protein